MIYHWEYRIFEVVMSDGSSCFAPQERQYSIDYDGDPVNSTNWADIRPYDGKTMDDAKVRIDARDQDRRNQPRPVREVIHVYPPPPLRDSASGFWSGIRRMLLGK